MIHRAHSILFLTNKETKKTATLIQIYTKEMGENKWKKSRNLLKSKIRVKKNLGFKIVVAIKFFAFGADVHILTIDGWFTEQALIKQLQRIWFRL